MRRKLGYESRFKQRAGRDARRRFAASQGLADDYRFFLTGGFGHGALRLGGFGHGRLGFFLAALFLPMLFSGFSSGVNYLLSAKLEKLFVVRDTAGNLVHFDFSPLEFLALINYAITGRRAMLNVEPKKFVLGAYLNPLAQNL